MGGAPSPPRVAGLIVSLVLPRKVRTTYKGDLDERFYNLVAKAGPTVARRWYWRQAAGFATRVPVARLRDGVGRLRRRHGASWLPALGRDIGYATRSLRARPGFTVPALAILALAVAANSTVLSIVDNVLFRDLPFADPDSVVVLWDVPPADDPYQEDRATTYRNYVTWKDQADLFAQVAAMETTRPAVQGGDYPVRANAMIVSGNLFSLLGVSPARGRLLTPADDTPGAEPVAVISDRLWRQRFGADPEIVGRTITVAGTATTVVGVTAPDFWFYDPWMWSRSVGERDTAQPDLWQPLHTRAWASAGFIDYPALRVFARLREGVGLEQARVAASAMRSNLAEAAAQPGFDVKIVPLEDQVVGAMRPRLLLLQAAVVLVLLVACVNVMSLVLAKSSANRSELAVRAALGAGRGSLLRLALVEGLVLGIVGGGLGLLLASSIGDLVLRVAPRELPLADRIGVDARVALLTLAIAAGAGLLAGLVPALSLDFGSLTASLRSGSQGIAGGLLGRRARFVLVAVEVTLTLVLLIGATVMTRSFLGLRATDPGFDPGGVLTFDVTLLPTPEGETPDYGLYDRILAGLEQLPGVEAAGATSHLPFSNWAMGRRVAAGDLTDPDSAPWTQIRRVNGDYISAMKLRLLAGRSFGANDDGSSEPVVIINEAFAERFLDVGNRDVSRLVGESVGLINWGDPPEVVLHRVVGIVGNVKHSELFAGDPAIAYLPFRQEPVVYQRFAVRTAGDPLALIEPIRAAVTEIDPTQPLAEFNTMAALLSQSITEERFYSSLLGAFGIVAFGLAGIGVYGSVAYSVRLRLREIGVRVAFGAQPRAIRRLIVHQGMAPVIVGIVAGAAGAVFLASGLKALLHGVSPFDVTSFVSAALMFAAVAGCAAWLPALRASKTDPVRTLRAD